jgi:hypothetical protein
LAATPAISIILITGRQRRRAEEALASILAQARIAEAEVLLVDLAADECPPVAGSDHPTVRIFPYRCDGHIGYVRSAAVRAASAPLVAFVEEHAIVLPGWLAATLDAFDSGPWSVVGPALRLGKDDSTLSLALACLSFGPWLAPTCTREMTTVIGHDSAYRRASLLALDDLDELLVAEPVLHAHLVERGEHILLCAAAEMYHRNESTVAAMLYDYFLWNISFGALRLRGKRPAERLLRLAATPAAPFARTWRAWPLLRRYVPAPTLPLATFYAFLCCVAQVAGLVMGYLGRTEGAAKRLSFAELGSPDRHPLPKEFR